jgi:hypothetical protein
VFPTTHTFVPGDANAAHFSLRFPSNTAVLGDLDVTIWHVVTHVTDEPGYRALNPNFGAGALQVTVVESDVPGFSLGNGVAGVILLEEPASATVPAVATPPGSVGIVLKSKPIGVVSLSLFEATNATNVLNPNAVAKKRRLLLADNVPVDASDLQMTIQSGATLRFTESDWFVPKEVVLSGVWKTGDQGRRTVTFCGTVDAPDDPAYLTLDAPCFNTVLTEFGAETGPRAVSFDLGVDVVVDQVSANAVSSLPALYQRFTGFWRVRAFLAVNGVRVTSPSEVPIAVTPTPIALSFQVDETYFANRDAVDAMFNLDPAVYEQWTPSLKSIAGVELVWGATDSVTGLTNVTGKVTKMGTYFLGQAFPALVVDNPTVAPMFKEKGVSSSVLHGLTIQPAEIAVDYPVAVTSATLGMKRFNPNTDVLNLPHCVLTGQDITEGCVLGPTDNVFAIYFPALGELTVRSVNDVPVTIARQQ